MATEKRGRIMMLWYDVSWTLFAIKFQRFYEKCCGCVVVLPITNGLSCVKKLFSFLGWVHIKDTIKTNTSAKKWPAFMGWLSLFAVYFNLLWQSKLHSAHWAAQSMRLRMLIHILIYHCITYSWVSFANTYTNIPLHHILMSTWCSGILVWCSGILVWAEFSIDNKIIPWA